MRVLCWFGLHNYEITRTIYKSEFVTLKGHECSRCGRIPDEQIGLERLALDPFRCAGDDNKD
jgi:hypothetical protein